MLRYLCVMCDWVCDVCSGIARVSRISVLLFSDWWPKPGPGLLQLDSGRGGVVFASVAASVQRGC